MFLYPAIKRLADILLSLTGIILLSPLLILLAILIKTESKGPVLFIQKRVGKNKSHFKIYKFRTMKVDAPKNMPTHMLKNPEMYITKLGRFLRRSALDELPQLLNILRGDMSVVGPRPALWNQYDLIKERDKYKANNIRPGLTGWAQINGRDELSITGKAQLDGVYVEKMSFLFDCKIFFLTIVLAFIGKDYSEGGPSV